MSVISQFFSSDFWQKVIAVNDSPWRIFISLLDIAIVAFIIYKLISFVQGTRLMILVRGVILFIAFDLVAGLLGLGTVKWLLNQVITYGVIALIVIFQPEIRQVLETLGRTTNRLQQTKKADLKGHVAAYEKSFDYMSKRKIGALIAVEQSQTLSEYANSGIRLDADVTAELIINIFIPNTPLHDGAVIVQGGKIAVASAYLPLTDRVGISKEFGTRHRAAIGLSEVSDALVLVVSEETGGVSIAHKGVFHADISAQEFHDMLTAYLTPDLKEVDNEKDK